ncbi:unnamed protein product [Closterium sp. NIES-54]
MIVYITFLRQWSVVTEFYANLSVDKCDASSPFLVLLTHLESNGVELAKISGISIDGASVMIGGKYGVVAPLRTRVPHLVSCHCIAHREALAAKDAATSIADLGIIDKVVRKVSDLLGRSSPKHSRFMQLQEVVTETNLEMQGMKDVRWLSRGDTIARLADVFPVVVLLLYEYDKKTYNIVTSFKFQFLLYFLADVLKDNLCDAMLGKLMTVLLLDYEMEPQAIMSVWHGSKKRRPAKEVVMAQAGRADKRAKRATSSTQASAVAASKAAAVAATRAARDAEAEAAREREEVAAEEARIPVWKRKSKGRVEEEEQVSEDEDKDDCSVSSSESDDDTE